MPKKFVGENSKSAAARARKASAKEAENVKKQRDLEDQYWKEDDKLIVKKQQRKEEQEKKRQQQLEKKLEAKMLLEKEMSAVTKSSTAKNQPPPKVTRAQIEIVKASKPAPKKEVVETHLTVPLEENINKLTVDGEEARSITEAIAVLSSKSEDVDKHPEKRLKAAYTAFEDRRLKQLKEENPTLRLSQLKQLIFKEWQKSPENPLNNV